MIKRNIGMLRKVIARRKDILHVVKTYIEADDAILISVKDRHFSTHGHINDAAIIPVMLGRTLYSSWALAQQQYKDASLVEYISQPATIAMGMYEKDVNDGNS